MDRDNHYEAAFAAYLRERHLPYIAVDESRRTTFGDDSIKSLDFLVYPASGPQLLIDIKGRRFPGGPPEKPRRIWENWATRDDVEGLLRWQERLGPDALALLVFVYHLDESVRLPIDTPDLWSFHQKCYLARAVSIASYQRWMRCRSPQWNTVFIPGDVFREIVQPFSTFLSDEAEILWPA